MCYSVQVFYYVFVCIKIIGCDLSLEELKYSEYETDDHKEVAVWEQNHCGDIRNYKKWIIEAGNY